MLLAIYMLVMYFISINKNATLNEIREEFKKYDTSSLYKLIEKAEKSNMAILTQDRLNQFSDHFAVVRTYELDLNKILTDAEDNASN